jgi:hypothetical protein
MILNRLLRKYIRETLTPKQWCHIFTTEVVYYSKQ